MYPKPHAPSFPVSPQGRPSIADVARSIGPDGRRRPPPPRRPHHADRPHRLPDPGLRRVVHDVAWGTGRQGGDDVGAHLFVAVGGALTGVSNTPLVTTAPPLPVNVAENVPVAFALPTTPPFVIVTLQLCLVPVWTKST